MTERLVGRNVSQTVLGNVLFIDRNNDRVGINTDTPQFTLDVVGDTNITGNLTVDTDTLFVDSANNRVGIGTTIPIVSLDIVKADTSTSTPMIRLNNTGTGDVSIAFISDTNDFIMGIDSSDNDKFKMTQDCDNLTANTRITFDGSKLGFGESDPLAKLHITQASATGVIPCLILEQADVDRHTIEFSGTESANATDTFSSFTSGGSIIGFIKTEVNGVVEYIPRYSAPTDTSGNLDMGGNEVINVVCQTIGALGYILLDEQTFTGLGTGFTTDIMNLDSQSTDEFAMYRLIFRGFMDGDGTTPQIRIRFHDIDGQMSANNGHWQSVYGYDAIIIAENRDESIIIAHSTTTSAVINFMGSLTLTLNGAVEEDCMLVGQSGIHNSGSNPRLGLNITGGITNSETINTRITGFGIGQVNTDGTGANISMRIYRLL